MSDPQEVQEPVTTDEPQTIGQIEATAAPHMARAAFPQFPGYLVQGELGRGGMGIVYRATQVGLNREVALKTMLPESRPSRSDLRRFLLEAETVAGLKHPNVVQVYDYGEHAGVPFMALELLVGGNLAERREKFVNLDFTSTAQLVAKIALGVAKAHSAGLVHRDLKPGNVLFDADDEPKVSDFGLVKSSTEEMTLTGAVLGTPAYMAPEQCRDAKYVGPPADVWALGVILYECLTGNRPFRSMDTWELLRSIQDDVPTPPHRSKRGIPRDLELVCLKCLEKNPADRYPTAAELATDLERFLKGFSVSVSSPNAIEQAYRWAKRRPTTAIAWALGVVAVILLLIGGVFSFLWDRAETALARESAARQSELSMRRSADALREKLAAAEIAERRATAQKSIADVLALLPELRRRALWPQALSLIRQASATGEQDLSQDAQNLLTQAAKEIELLQELDEIRMRKAALASADPDSVWKSVEIQKSYEAAFRKAGIYTLAGQQGQVNSGAFKNLAESPIRDELIAAIDDWAWLVRDEAADSLWQLTAKIRGEPWRESLRFASVSAPEALRLTQEIPVADMTPSLVCGFGLTLRLFIPAGSRHAVEWLEKGAAQFPSDFWVAFYLGVEYLRRDEHEAAAGAFRAALAVRPDATLARECLDRCRSLPKSYPSQDFPKPAESRSSQ